MAVDDRFPWFPLYVLDFVGDGIVEAMSTEAVGAYFLLLCKAWHQTPAGTLPDDDETLARWARLSPKLWAKHKAAVMRAFRLEDGRWLQKRLASEHAKIVDERSRKTSAGRRGAAGRWQCDRNATALADALRSQSDPNGKQQSQSQSQSQSKSNTPPSPLSGGDTDEPKFDPLAVKFPDCLETPECRAAWSEWVAFRRERKPGLTPLAVKKQLKALAEYGPHVMVRAIEESIRNSYQGLFPKKIRDERTTAISAQRGGANPPTLLDREERRLNQQLSALERYAAEDQ